MSRTWKTNDISESAISITNHHFIPFAINMTCTISNACRFVPTPSPQPLKLYHLRPSFHKHNPILPLPLHHCTIQLKLNICSIRLGISPIYHLLAICTTTILRMSNLSMFVNERIDQFISKLSNVLSIMSQYSARGSDHLQSTFLLI